MVSSHTLYTFQQTADPSYFYQYTIIWPVVSQIGYHKDRCQGNCHCYVPCFWRRCPPGTNLDVHSHCKHQPVCSIAFSIAYPIATEQDAKFETGAGFDRVGDRDTETAAGSRILLSPDDMIGFVRQRKVGSTLVHKHLESTLGVCVRRCLSPVHEDDDSPCRNCLYGVTSCECNEAFGEYNTECFVRVSALTP
jgi:hypothetical protein